MEVANMIAERNHYLFSHTQIMFLDSDLRTLWYGQDKYALGFALDISKRYVDRANRYPLLGGCDVRKIAKHSKTTQEYPSGFYF